MIEEVEYKGWKSLRLRTEAMEFVVPLEIGPRVVFGGRPGGANLFAERSEEAGGRGEDHWCIRGGHRLWHSPEAFGRTYALDNAPIAVIRLESGLRLEQPTEATTGIRKSMTLVVVNANTLKVTHTLTNEGVWPVACAPWALTVMRHGGFAAIPLLPKESHEGNLLPKYHMVPWTYTDFSEPAWRFHRDFIGIDVAKSRIPQKLGLSNYPGWSAYWQEAGTFVIDAPVIPGAVYPDFGCAFETFHCDWMVELETLGPLVDLPPGGSATHIEHWGVFADLPKFDNDAAFAEALVPTVEAWRKGFAG